MKLNSGIRNFWFQVGNFLVVSANRFIELEKKSTIVRKQAMKQKNILLAMVEATLFQMNPKTEWLGDYPKITDKRRATN